jgi:hypothetical protein
VIHGLTHPWLQECRPFATQRRARNSQVRSLRSVHPSASHEVARFAGQHPNDFAEVAGTSVWRFEGGEVAEDFFLAARNERLPVRSRLRVRHECLLEPRGQAILGSTAIARVKSNLDAHALTDGCSRRLPHVAVQVQIEGAIAHRHHVDPPGLSGLPLMRTQTGSGLRQPDLTAFARRALTKTYGLIPRILMVAVKVEVGEGIRGVDPLSRASVPALGPVG